MSDDAARPSLAGIEARVAGATPGPWSVETDTNDSYEDGIDDGDFPVAIHGPSTMHVWRSTPSLAEEYGHRFSEVGELTLNDADLIAAAPTDLIALTAAVRAVLAVADAGDERAESSPARAWYGASFPALVGTADLRAALAAHLDLGGER